jgi:hypothetical protein
MKTKRAKSKTAVKKAAKAKTSSASKKKNEKNAAEVRQDIAVMVQSEAATMARAVIDLGKTGQLAPVKYLLELARIFPPSTEGSESTAHEDSLAQTLLNRLNLPDEPIMRDEEDGLVMIRPTVRVAAEDRAEEREPHPHHCEEESSAQAGDTKCQGRDDSECKD